MKSGREPRWYVLEDDAASGPFDPPALAALIHRNSLVWRDGMADWERAGRVPDLSEILAAKRRAVPADETSPGGRMEPSAPAGAPAAQPLSMDGPPSAEPVPPTPAGPPQPSRASGAPASAVPEAAYPAWLKAVPALMGFFLGSCLLGLAWLGAGLFLGLSMEPGAVMTAVGAIGGAACALAVIHAGWSCVRGRPGARNPWAAAGLLLVPVFNLYWQFKAIPGLMAVMNAAARERGAVLPWTADSAARIFCWLSVLLLLPLLNGLILLFWLVMLFVAVRQIAENTLALASPGVRTP
ncbi:MAG: hypothetical protein GMKNLPBB_00801 [Myxococcota bacterium]|nr:hypothetical protein [Myxococcota bacterium]